MKNIINNVFFLIILAIGGVFAYSSYYNDIGVSDAVMGSTIAYVDVDVADPKIIKEVIIDKVKEEVVKEPVEVIIPPVKEEVVQPIIKEAPIVDAKQISIILTDVSNENIDNVISLLGDNKYVGLAFSRGNYDAMKKAREAGFQNIIASVTMQPIDETIYLPRHTLRIQNSAEKNVKILNEILEDSYMPMAITNKMGSKFTSKEYVEYMEPIMLELKVKNLGFIDSKSNYYSVAGAVAEAYDVPHAENYMFFDRDVSSNTIILNNLDKLKERADAKGVVLGMGNYSAKMIKALDVWLAGLETNNMYELIPVSALMK